MVVTQIGLAYRRLQGDVYQWRLKADRRSVPTIVEREVDGKLKKFREMIDGLSTEALYNVQEVDVKDGLGKVASRAARYALGEISERTSPESLSNALENVETYTVTVYREDRQKHQAVYRKKRMPVIDGVVWTVLTLRAIPVMDEPMECPGVYPSGYLGGSLKGAVTRALRELRDAEELDARR